MNDSNGQQASDRGPGRVIVPGYYEYKGTIPLMELPCDDAYATEDAYWFSLNPDLYEVYKGQCVALFQRAVWGVGENEEAAWADAQKKPGCPEWHRVTFLHLVPFLVAQKQRESNR